MQYGSAFARPARLEPRDGDEDRDRAPDTGRRRPASPLSRATSRSRDQIRYARISGMRRRLRLLTCCKRSAQSGSEPRLEPLPHGNDGSTLLVDRASSPFVALPVTRSALLLRPAAAAARIEAH